MIRQKHDGSPQDCRESGHIEAVEFCWGQSSTEMGLIGHRLSVLKVMISNVGTQSSRFRVTKSGYSNQSEELDVALCYFETKHCQFAVSIIEKVPKR